MLQHMTGFPSFFKMHKSLCIYVTRVSINGHLVCFQVLAIVNNAVSNISTQKSLQDANCSYFKKYPEEGLLNYVVVLVLIF